MSFPNYPNKYKNVSILNPENIVEYRRHLGRLPKTQFPQGVLFCLERGLPKRLRRRIPVRMVGSMLGDLYMVKKSKDKVGVMANFGGGAPIVTELAEELVVLGAKEIIIMTWGGALQPDLAPGDIVVNDRAIRDEGTSHHYLPPSKYVPADPQLVDRLANAIVTQGSECTIGTTWTTDAPYRETLEEVQQYQAEGVKTVEMESAGLFAIGEVRNVRTASVVVIMDSLAKLEWEVPDKLDRIQKSLETVYSAAIKTLSAS
ncbi:MAG: nucleoside phosphorylase [Chloroflexi bacterium]|nr:nucleoside phosphorylase [Chloroflexota bacterium]